jgi:putative DNA primase/helicase
MTPIEAEFLHAIEAAGLVPPDEIIGDGKLHRFSSTGKRCDDAGWYVLHLDGVAAGSFGDWRSDVSGKWCAKADSQMTAAERQAVHKRVRRAQLAREADTILRQAEAAKTAAAIWLAAPPAIAHPYLKAKGVRAHGVRINGELLLVPVRDADGALCSLQTISASGEKRFLPGGKVRGCYHSIGRPEEKLLVCEGYATGATLYESCTRHGGAGYGVAVAFNASNLEPVARALRDKYQKADLTICADDDWQTPGNPGMTAARRAALAVGGKLAVPNFSKYRRGAKDYAQTQVQRRGTGPIALAAGADGHE